MQIAIASDLHDNLTNWERFNRYVQKQGISTLFFCGDLTSAETLAIVRSTFKGEIHMIAGNAETYDFDELKSSGEFFHYGRQGMFALAGKRFALIHEPSHRSRLLSDEGSFDYLFYGHTHKPWIQNEGKMVNANPGTLGGVYYAPTFALLDTDTGKLELKLLDNLGLD
ncbi:MAG: metallophosphoesterase family protein [Bacillota bacterium]